MSKVKCSPSVKVNYVAEMDAQNRLIKEMQTKTEIKIELIIGMFWIVHTKILVDVNEGYTCSWP